MISVYLAGPLFTQAERRWNIDLKVALERLSHDALSVTLPQYEAERFIAGESIDLDGIVADCLHGATEHDLVLAILDGADVDSGTAVELAYRKGRNEGVVIGVRTDFRRSEDPVTGVNAMLRICDDIVHFPFDVDIDRLAQMILCAIEQHVSDYKSPA